MKKTLTLLLSILFLLSAVSGCGATNTVKDGRARPSSCGELQVIEGRLCDQKGNPAMLRGVSTHDLITTESFINDDLFRELSEEYGVNVVRLAVYTYGVGVIGYCTKGDKDRYKQNVANGVAYAKAHDMYAIIDWHILSDADPLSFGNVMYTLHFYAATHGQEYRDMLAEVREAGLPVFVTEYGVTASSGGLPRDLESADLWIDLLERENVSYCMWALSKAPEACSMVRSTVPKYRGFAHDDFTETGQWLLETLKKQNVR